MRDEERERYEGGVVKEFKNMVLGDEFSYRRR